MMLETMNLETFAAHVNTDFQVLDDRSKPFTLKLTQVLKRIHTPKQEAFSLFFHGPAAYPMLQGIYQLCHAELGELALFLVPVGKDEDGFEYEAVFNTLIQPKQ